jgi:hypothetical protein
MDEGLKLRQFKTDSFAQELDPDTFEPIGGFWNLGNQTKVDLGNTGNDINPVKGQGTKTKGTNIDAVVSYKNPEVTIESNTMRDEMLALALNCNLMDEEEVAGTSVTGETHLCKNKQQIILANRYVTVDNNNLPIVTITTPEEGTGTGYKVNGNHAIGTTEIAIDTGTGTVLDTETVTIGTRDYVLKRGLVDGKIVLQVGLKEAITDNTDVTIIAQKTLVQGTDFEADSMHNNFIEIKDGVLGLGVTLLTCAYDFHTYNLRELTRGRKSAIVIRFFNRTIDLKSNDIIDTQYRTCYVASDAVIGFISSDTEPMISTLKLTPIYDPVTQSDFGIRMTQRV